MGIWYRIKQLKEGNPLLFWGTIIAILLAIISKTIRTILVVGAIMYGLHYIAKNKTIEKTMGK